MAKHPMLRRVFGIGVLAGAAYAIWRAIEANRTPGQQDVGWEPQPFPFPPQPRTSDATDDGQGDAKPDAKQDTKQWVEPAADGACPVGYPVKGKLSSGIYHVPGGVNYERTTPDRCYADERAAEADGLRASKR